MTKSLNIYATKVFSEQPLALWALDDTTDYIALIDSDNQDLSAWSVSGASVVDATAGAPFSEAPPRSPFQNEYTSGVLESIPNSGTVTFTSSVAIQPEDINQDLGSFAMGAYFFTYDRTANVRLGYEYTDPDTLAVSEVIRNSIVPAERQWAFVSKTFPLPAEFQDLKFIIEVSYTLNPSSPYVSEYEFAVNGINIGQWSEEFHLESLGVFPEELPSNINIDSYAVPALPYGLDGSNGYYLSRNNQLFAKNSGLPLVHGAFNSTVLFPNEDRPSLILPGFGFMNESGQYKSFTFEFWIKIQSNAQVSRKIFGPIASEDGLYVDGPFLKLRVGEGIASHYIGEWDRPMLIDIRLTSRSASLILNGEEVMSLDIDDSLIDFPEKIDESDNDQDWVGFYAYIDVPLVQVDCVGIYPYEVPAIVAKRRWVYGQGVDYPTNIQGSAQASSVLIDYPFANYSKNYSYPQIGRWRNGVIENLVPDEQQLSLPSYTLPTINFDNKTNSEWYTSSENAQGLGTNFISLKPDVGWDDTNGHMLFESLNILLEETKAFYGIFEVDSVGPDKQILFELVNEKSGATLTIAIEEQTTPEVDHIVTYTLKSILPSGGTEEELLYYCYLLENQQFLVGLHIPRFVAQHGRKLSSFFGAKQNIRVFVGGGSSLTNTFKGKMYRIGFSTERNLKKIGGAFSGRGVPMDFENVFDNYEDFIFYNGGSPDTEFWNQYLDGGDPYDFPKVDTPSHLASYTLLPKIELGRYILDIGIDSYWEDYLPLSYFGKYVANAANVKKLEFDFLQLNLDYPRFANFSEGNYDSTGSMVKTYVTFQYLAAGSNKTYSSFLNTKFLPNGGVVLPAGDEWLDTKYEVLNDTIIYAPPGINFKSLSINIHIEMGIQGIISNPVRISSLQLASQSLGFSPNKIGTRFGADIHPYRKVGSYYDYKNVSPYSIYKGSTPHLYLTGSSGIRMRGDFSTSDNLGIASPINKSLNSFFKLSAVQLAFRYDEKLFPESPVQIFEIEDKTKTVKFYLVKEASTALRGYIFAIDGNTGQVDPTILYTVDGKATNRASINSNTWTVLGLSFQTPLDFSLFAGALRVTSPILVNNISYYQITKKEEEQRFSYRKWYAVRSEPDNPLNWEDWEDSTWQQVLFLTEAKPSVIDTSKIYKQFTGTDRVVVQDETVLKFNNYKYSMFKDVKWTRQILDSA